MENQQNNKENNQGDKTEKKGATIEEIASKLENIDEFNEEDFDVNLTVPNKEFFGEHVPNVCYISPNLPAQIYYHLERKKFYINSREFEVSVDNMLKYLKTTYPKYGIFKRDVLDGLHESNDTYGDNIIGELIALFDDYESIEKFTFREAFEIESQQLRALVFGALNVSDMIAELGSTKIKVEGKPMNLKKYSSSGEFLGFEEKHSIYETYEIDGAKLGVDTKLYAVKCWCTTTNKEHWIWIESNYKDSPLEAIASTARFSATIIPHIKSIKRQGDIFLLEMNQDVTPKEDDVRPLTADEYFSLLVAES